VTSEVGRRAGEAWAFRTRVERDAARRFRRLAVAIAGFDSASPVPGLLAAAAGDEERHADLCAGLAAAYGQPAVEVGPDLGVAPQQLAPRDAALYEMVAACCITETESVATLATLLAAGVEPAVRAVLHQIARDEVSHGRMGWAHLAREAALRDVAFLSEWIPAMLSGTVDDDLFAPGDDEPAALLRHGVLPQARKRELFIRTLEEVVIPGLEHLGVGGGPGRDWLAARRPTR